MCSHRSGLFGSQQETFRWYSHAYCEFVIDTVHKALWSGHFPADCDLATQPSAGMRRTNSDESEDFVEHDEIWPSTRQALRSLIENCIKDSADWRTWLFKAPDQLEIWSESGKSELEYVLAALDSPQLHLTAFST